MSLEDAFKSELGKEVVRLRKENQEVHEAVIRKQKELMRIRGSLVTEQCHECGAENTIEWNMAKQGYYAFCPNCGDPMMLCWECVVDSGFCDWDEDTSLCYRVVEKFWDNLSVVPFCYIASENHRGNLSDVPASGNVDVDMRLVLENEHKLMFGNKEIITFPSGTDRDEIWEWFDKRYPGGWFKLMNRNSESEGEEKDSDYGESGTEHR